MGANGITQITHANFLTTFVTTFGEIFLKSLKKSLILFIYNS